ncbi:MAG: NTP transferase domain-containing protein [Candidatus Omnitrophica bacterium]|nr:NTP transferase domain-containing protein [Candidatus Omnitrophota bacterium]
MKDTVAIVLAAGRGTRMKSETPKVLHNIFGKPIISYVLDSLKNAGITRIITVAGYGSDDLRKTIDTKIVIQKKLLGSGDAVQTAKKLLGSYSGNVIVICGDTPLVTSETIKKLISKHRASGSSATLTTIRLKDPAEYGRIVRGSSGDIVKIAEEIGASDFEKTIDEVNVGTYCFKAKDLFGALKHIKPDQRKKELFLTDTIEILNKAGKVVESVTLTDADEMIGINSRKDLAEATRFLKNKIIDEMMLSGVTVEDPLTTTIYPDAKIGQDTIIHPNTFIGPNVKIGKRCHIGPFARLTANVRVGQDVMVGNFVELVRTKIGDGCRVKHHTYLGDTSLGRKVNIGAGTITANYDGKNKNKTVVKDNAFIGVSSVLIAPITIGKNATVGAGCVVLRGRNVPDGKTVVGVPAKILEKRSGKARRESDEKRLINIQR